MNFWLFFSISVKIDHKKFVVNGLYQKLFTKNKFSHNINDILEFYENLLVVCTKAFILRSFTFPPMPLIPKSFFVNC